MKVAAIIPVAPFESKEILLRSVKKLKKLKVEGEFKILYVVDLRRKEDKRGEILRRCGVEVLERENTRGKRAGAINDGLKFLSSIGFKPDYVAIFDVDSEPDENFIVENLKMLREYENDRAYISSSPRYVSNAINFVSKTVWLEYFLLNYMVKKGGYKQFNGLIGVLKAEYLYRYGLREDAITEDADFSTRMHIMGYKGVYCEKSKIFEQAPLSWKDLYNQRKRWYYGGLQLWRYWKEVKKCKNKKFKRTWILALTLTYLPALMIPWLILAPFLIGKKFGIGKIYLTLGLFVHAVVLQTAAFSAVASFIRKKGIDWKPSKRC